MNAGSRPKPAGREPDGARDTAARMSVVLDRARGAAAAGSAAFSKARHAYEVLRGEILDGRHAPGSWLRLTPIAERLALSEMPVREAMRLLEQDGLVTIHLHRGAQVAGLSFARALEITEARMCLEEAAAVAAIPHHDAATLDAAEGILAEMRALGRNRVEFALKNREFATAVYAPCPNQFLREHVQHLWDQVWQYSSVSVFEVMRHRVADSLRENRDICAAIRARDVAAARAVYALRLQRSIDAWQRAIARIQARAKLPSAAPARRPA